MGDSSETSTLSELMLVIEDRRNASSQESYTAKLLSQGVPAIAEKIIEEAREVVEAAGEPGPDGRQHLISEAADLIYHLLVMLAARDSRLSDVEAELARRFGISGLVEKQSRPKDPTDD